MRSREINCTGRIATADVVVGGREKGDIYT